MAAEDGAN